MAWQPLEAVLLQLLIAGGVSLAARGGEQAGAEEEHDGQQNRGCYPDASQEPHDCWGRLRGDHVGEIEHVTQSPAHICVSNLPDEVDVRPCCDVEFVALQQEGEGVGAGCAGITDLGPARCGEQLLHLFPAAVAYLPDGGIDQAQGLPSCQVQKVKAVIKP